MSLSVVHTTAEDVVDVADQIRQLHKSVEGALTRGLEAAIQAGELLAAERERRLRGRDGGDGYNAWVEREVRISQPTASFYVRAFEHRAKIIGAGAQTKAEAMRVLSTGSPEISEEQRQVNRRRNRRFVESKARAIAVGGGRLEVNGRMIDCAAEELCRLLSPFGYPRSPNEVVRRHAHRILVAALEIKPA